MHKLAVRPNETRNAIEERISMNKLFAQDYVNNVDFSAAGLTYYNVAIDLRRLHRLKGAKVYFCLAGKNYAKAAETEYKSDMQYSLLSSDSGKFKQLHNLYSKASESFKEAGMPEEWANYRTQADRFQRLYESARRHRGIPMV